MVIKARAYSEGHAQAKGKAGSFTGVLIGRGTGTGHVLSSCYSVTNIRARRVIVKRHLVNLQKYGPGMFVAHLGCLQRDGVTRESESSNSAMSSMTAYTAPFSIAIPATATNSGSWYRPTTVRHTTI